MTKNINKLRKLEIKYRKKLNKIERGILKIDGGNLKKKFTKKVKQINKVKNKLSKINENWTNEIANKKSAKNHWLHWLRLKKSKNIIEFCG